MPKIKPEKVTGIVALSYLLLIPAAALVAYRKIVLMDRDIADILAELKMNPGESTLPVAERFKGLFR